jgi:hypothetical protein
MLKRWILISGLLTLAIVILAGVIQRILSQNPLQSKLPLVMIAHHIAEPISVDGVLDEPVWQQTKVYPMNLSLADARSPGHFPHEGGKVRLLWDQNNLYVGVELTDLDIVAEGNKDQLYHFRFGDVLEVFLKPENKPCYVELCITPGGYKTWFFWPKLGDPPQIEDIPEFTVKAKCRGTLNKGTDIDECWSAEMAIPIKALVTVAGEDLGPDSQWRLLVGRYNYSRQLPIPWLEYSMMPALKRTDFQLQSEYARLQLEHAPALTKNQ